MRTIIANLAVAPIDRRPRTVVPMEVVYEISGSPFDLAKRIPRLRRCDAGQLTRLSRTETLCGSPTSQVLNRTRAIHAD